jgi:hypothetical protein
MKINEGYQLKSMGGHSVVTSGEQGDTILFALNETGAFLWKGIQEGLSKEELKKKLCLEYEADPEEEELIANDVEEFLLQLKTMGVLD